MKMNTEFAEIDYFDFLFHYQNLNSIKYMKKAEL